MQKVSCQINFSRVFAALMGIYFSTASSVTLADSSWQGPYLGLYTGAGFGSNHILSDAGDVTGTSYFPNLADINAISDAASSKHDPTSAIVGIQAGHDWAWKKMVYGIVMDYGALPLDSSDHVSGSYVDNSGQYAVSTSMSTNWLFTLRGRLGYQLTIPRKSLVYLTGGMAMTQLNINNNFIDDSALTGMGNSHSSENKIGWTAGVGMEVASFRHTSVSLEYLYLRVPSINTVASVSNSVGGFGIPEQSLTSPLTSNGRFHANLLKIALNYRFDE